MLTCWALGACNAVKRLRAAVGSRHVLARLAACLAVHARDPAGGPSVTVAAHVLPRQARLDACPARDTVGRAGAVAQVGRVRAHGALLALDARCLVDCRRAVARAVQVVARLARRLSGFAGGHVLLVCACALP